jgi:hypothetical protein
MIRDYMKKPLQGAMFCKFHDDHGHETDMCPQDINSRTTIAIEAHKAK